MLVSVCLRIFVHLHTHKTCYTCVQDTVVGVRRVFLYSVFIMES